MLLQRTRRVVHFIASPAIVALALSSCRADGTAPTADAQLSPTGGVQVELTLEPGVTLPSVNGTAVTLADFGATAASDTVSVTQSFEAATGITKFHLPPSSKAYTITLVPPTTLNTTAAADPDPPAALIVAGLESRAVTFILGKATVKP